jgi:hypothetical protein
MHHPDDPAAGESRRAFITTAAWVTPAILTLAARPSFAALGSNIRPSEEDDPGGEDPVPEPKPKGNNGVGNGEDPQPPGNPPINDGPGTGPGHPGNQGGTPSGGRGPGNGGKKA